MLRRTSSDMYLRLEVASVRTGEILKGVAEIQYFYLQNLVETANSFF